MYEKGEGVQRDDSEALKWCVAAAEPGHAGSQNNLGVRYETGEGVTKDIIQAFHWYSKAAANGFEWLREHAENSPGNPRKVGTNYAVMMPATPPNKGFLATSLPPELRPSSKAAAEPWR